MLQGSPSHHEIHPDTEQVVHLTIDGHRVRVAASSTILQAARAHRIEIPSLCSDPRISPGDDCGMCVVKLNGSSNMVRACVTKVAAEMTVVTEDEEIAALRSGILSGLLSDHNAYCEAPCHYACPAGIDIPAYLGAIAKGEDARAISIIKERLPLPRIIGRVCPRPCEDSCRRTQVDGEPVAICQLKRFSGDKVKQEGTAIVETVATSTGKKAAVIGSGPSGLSAAYYLAKAGHAVTIFEAAPEPGGMTQTGIPSYRLPKDVIQEEVDDILALGVELKLNTGLGRDFSLQDLSDQGYDSTYLAIGAQKGSTGGLDEPDGIGVLTAVDFLNDVNAGEFSGELGKTVVIGGGFTALDAARSAQRLGADEVTVVYRRTKNEMPASDFEVRDAGHEGVKFAFLTAPCEITRDNAGNVAGVVCQRMELGPEDESGRRRPVAVAESDFTHDADTVIFAIGQDVDGAGITDVSVGERKPVSFDRWGTIVSDPLTMATSMNGVYAGGDCEMGPATVVQAIAAGRRAAVAMDAHMNGADPAVACSDPFNGLERMAPEFFDIAASPKSDAKRAQMPELALDARAGFDEIELGFTEDEARAEAARCLQCSCHEASACELQRLSQKYKAGATEFKGATGAYPAYSAAPMFELDRNRCIKCHNCVRICDEVQMNHCYVVDEAGYPMPKGGSYASAGCVYCGQCLSACPTGALKDLTDRGVLRQDERSSVQTTCPYCGVGCKFDAQVEGETVVAVKNNLDTPVNQGNLCVKGRFGFSFHDHPDRLKKPLIRESRDQEFREASWEEALSYVARRYSEIHAAHGRDSFAALTSSRGLNEENYVAQKFFRTVIGTNNVDNCARVCHAPSVAGLYRAFGSGAATNPLEDIYKSDFLFVIGSNTTEGHPVVGTMIKRAVAAGAKLIVADPRKIELVELADDFMQLKAGTNVALLNGMLNVLITENLIDEDFILERTEGFDVTKQIVAQYTPEYVEEITGVPAATLREAAIAYGKAERAMILYGLGMTEHRQGSHGVMCLANLAMASGNVGRPGAGIIVLRGQNNVQGSCDMGALPDYYTGYQRVDDPAARDKFMAFWNADYLSPEPGLKEPQMYRAAIDGDVKVLHVIGYDPVKTQGNLHFVWEGYDAAEFVVVQDIFLTATAQKAHVVLPAACYFEKDGTFTNGERRIQRVKKVIEPPEGLGSDWEIICNLAKAMGADMHFDDASAVMDEVAACTPQFTGVSYSRLENQELHWPVWDKEHDGSPLLHHGNFTKGKGTFHDIPYGPSAEVPDDEYPLLLTTGRVLWHYCNGSMTLRTPLLELSPEEVLEINQVDADKWGLTDGARAKVTSRRGEVDVRVKVTDRSQPGCVFLSFHYDETPVNVITGPGQDELALTPEYKVCAVQVASA